VKDIGDFLINDLRSTLKFTFSFIILIMIIGTLYSVSPPELKESLTKITNTIIFSFKLIGVIGGIAFLVFLINWAREQY